MSNRLGACAEILAPAGGMESLIAAVRCGAHAIYLGGKNFSARQNADNFDEQQLKEAVEYCHERGVKVYQTYNTLLFDDEIDDFLRALKISCGLSVDALIVQDLAAAALVRKYAPAMPLHASTQMSIHNLQGARVLEELGFCRAVLAREMSKAEIERVRAGTNIELECFVHGALCMSVSGICYLSAMIGGRSGNRGHCAGPCRLPFTAPDGRQFALSLKDLSLISHAPELSQIGVCSLKIEGRMKRPEYVAAAVTALRKSLAGEVYDEAVLQSVFSRSGFTDGYYNSQLGKEMFGVRRKEDVTGATSILGELSLLYKDERQSLDVSFSLGLSCEKPAWLRVSDADGNTVTVTGAFPQAAINAPTTAEKAEQSLSKTGGTPYKFAGLTAEIEPGVMLPASQLNALRREALEKLAMLIKTSPPRGYTDFPRDKLLPHLPAGKPRIRVRLARADQLTIPLAQKSDEIVIPITQFSHLPKDLLRDLAEKIIIELPLLMFDVSDEICRIIKNLQQAGITHAMVGGLGAIRFAGQLGLTLHGDYSLNVTNSISAQQYAKLGVADLTVSFELTTHKIARLGGNIPRGILVYGYLPLMAVRNCPIADCAVCKKNFPRLKDRLGNEFALDCGVGYSQVYNCLPLVLSDRISELPPLDFWTFYFTDQSSDDCLNILEIYQNSQSYPGDKTRGLYFRKVL